LSEDEFERLRKHFRSEISKLDRWLYQGKIEEYFEPPESDEAARLKKELLERLSRVLEELKEVEGK
jgi:hypothetical protein